MTTNNWVLGTDTSKKTASLYNLSGIYQIKNIENGKRYIGGSVNLGQRFARHKRELRKGKHKNIILQNAYNKHGKEKFVYSVRLLCNKKDVIKYEQAHLDKLRPEYNIAFYAKAPQAGRNLSKEHREKLMAGRDRYIKENGVWNKGKKLSNEHCINLSLSHIGYHPTKEHRKNLSEYHKANPNSGQFHPGSSGNQKISNPEIGELRQTYKDREFVRGEKMKFYKEMADKYNISSDHIRTILRNDLWRNT